MKKTFFLPAALGAGATVALHRLYRYIYYSPVGRQGDDYFFALPHRSEGERARSVSLIDRLNARPYERVFVTSFDGLRLAGRYFHSRDGAPLAILCHGYRGTPSRDFCGGADVCFQAGCNVLLIEQRAHGASEGHTISFGVNERYDVVRWANYAVERFGSGVRIVLAGISMGATAVLMATALPLPENVRGVIADCPFTSPRAIICEVGRQRGFPAEAVWPFAVLSARLYGGFNPNGADAAEAVKRARVPILLIHGEDDDFVPCAMSRQIADANPARIEYHTFPGAGHGVSYLADTPRYTELVKSFFERVLRE